MSDDIHVEVAWVESGVQVLRRLTLPIGSTAGEAIAAAGSGEHMAPLDDSGGVGVHGRLCDLQEPLRDGDRVELYRPLKADPKAMRRQRVQEMRAEKKRRS